MKTRMMNGGRPSKLNVSLTASIKLNSDYQSDTEIQLETVLLFNIVEVLTPWPSYPIRVRASDKRLLEPAHILGG